MADSGENDVAASPSGPWRWKVTVCLQLADHGLDCRASEFALDGAEDAAHEADTVCILIGEFVDFFL